MRRPNDRLLSPKRHPLREELNTFINEGAPYIISTGIAAVVVGMGALAVIGGPAIKDAIAPDPNKIGACPEGWANGDTLVVSQGEAHMAMQSGTSQFIGKITIEAPIKLADKVSQSKVSGNLRSAADILLPTDGLMYKIDETNVSTPSEEFCKVSDTYSSTDVYKSPAYVQAEAALGVAGIDISNASAIER